MLKNKIAAINKYMTDNGCMVLEERFQGEYIVLTGYSIGSENGKILITIKTLSDISGYEDFLNCNVMYDGEGVLLSIVRGEELQEYRKEHGSIGVDVIKIMHTDNPWLSYIDCVELFYDIYP